MQRDVLFDREIPEFASPATRAFEVSGSGDLFAMVCDHSYYPRYGVYSKLKSTSIKNLLIPIDMFSVAVPYDKSSKKTCFIFHKPSGKRFSSNQLVSLKNIKNIIIPNIYSILDELDSLSISHRAIRADNIFFDENEKIFTLNECVTSQPGMFQPSVYEEVNRQLCTPFLRGEGNVSTDLYSLGVLLVTLASGREPFFGASNNEIAEKKFEQGTFFAIVSDANLISYNLKEILQGLLQDKKKIRWELKDLHDWIVGGIKVRNFVRRMFKTSPIVLKDVKIGSIIQFLLFVINNWKYLSSKLDMKRINDWIVKNFSDKTLTEKIETIAFTKKSQLFGVAQNELALIAVCFAITGKGPFIWRKWVFMPDAISQLLLYCFFIDDSVPALKELARTKTLSGICSLFNLYEKDLYEILEHEISYNFNGCEYCLYRFNDDLPCMSPVIESQIVFDVKDIIPAIEKNVKLIKKHEIIDSHVLTFLNKNIKNNTIANFSFNNLRDIEGQMKILMAIENVSDENIEHKELSKIVINASVGFINEYKNKKTREELEKNIKNAQAKNISFKEIYKMVNNIPLLKNDIEGFKKAKILYKNILKNITRITTIYLNSNSISSYFAEKITLTLSMFIALVIVIVMLKVFVWSGGA